jgi:BirA family biotin operon repressor/biotin-[acetyl-CoA-carboxylase] ligase
MSTLLRPRIDRKLWGGISLVAGAAAHEALVEIGAAGVRLYWPNDLEVGDRKLGGILGEVRARGERAWVALGFGINIDLRAPQIQAAMPEELRQTATCLAEVMDRGREPITDPVALGKHILDHFWLLYEAFLDGEPLSALVRDRLAHVGGKVEVRQPGGAPSRGVLKGIGPHGELLVETGSKVLAVVAGDVVYDNRP